MNEQRLSEEIEQLLVARNPRHMEVARAALRPGYYLRAARHLRDIRGTVIIGTGFPVSGTFETDGPVGAMALYQALAVLGAHPLIACDAPLSHALAPDYRVLELTRARPCRPPASRRPCNCMRCNRRRLSPSSARGWPPTAATIICAGRTSRRTAFSSTHLSARPTALLLPSATAAMKSAWAILPAPWPSLDISASVTRCDELLVADVSNWGAYGLIAFLALWAGQDLLASVSPVALLNYLSARGSVDGVTGANTLTEDGLQARQGMRVIAALRALTNFPPS